VNGADRHRHQIAGDRAAHFCPDAGMEVIEDGCRVAEVEADALIRSLHAPVRFHFDGYTLSHFGCQTCDLIKGLKRLLASQAVCVT